MVFCISMAGYCVLRVNGKIAIKNRGGRGSEALFLIN